MNATIKAAGAETIRLTNSVQAKAPTRAAVAPKLRPASITGRGDTKNNSTASDDCVKMLPASTAEAAPDSTPTRAEGRDNFNMLLAVLPFGS